MIKLRCSLSSMPSDIGRNPISQLPYLNQPFDLVRAEAEEAGYQIEHWDGDSLDPRAAVHTLQVRGPHILIIATRNGLVKKIGSGCWLPDSTL